MNFKDRLDKLGDQCEPGGRIVDYKSKLPPGEPSPVTPPTTGTQEVCDCVTNKMDEVIDELRNIYPYGPVFNTGRLFTSVATPVEIDQAVTKPSLDPSIIGFYDETLVAPKRNNLNARQIKVLADPDGAVDPNDPFLYVRMSTGPNTTFTPEVPVRVGEFWEFEDVFAFRIRGPVKGQQYRITTNPVHTTFVSTIVNVPSPTVTPVTVSGNVIITSVSGNIVQISGQQVDISGQAVSVSGNIVQISGQQVEISGQIISLTSGTYVAIDDIDPITRFRELPPSIILDSGEVLLLSGIIDNINQFAYFGTDTSPGIIVKIDLETFTRVSSIILNSGENQLACGVIDTLNGFAYFGTSDIPGKIIKVDLATFTQVSAMTLNSGESVLGSAVLDDQNGFAYFGTGAGINSRDKVVKINLSNFSRVGAVTLNSGEFFLSSAVIDSGFAYFGTDNSTPNDVVVQINLSNFTRTGGVILSSGEIGLFSAVIDPINETAYFGTFNTTAPADKVVKVTLLPTPVRIGAITLNSGEQKLNSAIINTATGFSYWGTDTTPGIVIKVVSSHTSFFRIGAITLNSGENDLLSAVVDTVNGFAYFGTFTVPGIITKIAIDFDELSIPAVTVSGNIVQISVSGNIVTADISGQYVAIDDISLTPQFREFSPAISLGSGYIALTGAVIDSQNGFAYFGTNNPTFDQPVFITKINLANFTRAAILQLSSGETFMPGAATIDAKNGFAYFGIVTAGTSDQIDRINLSTFTETNPIILHSGETLPSSAVIDTINGFAYFGTANVIAATVPDSIIKINLTTFSRVGSIVLNSGERHLFTAVIESGFSYFGTANGFSTNASIIKINLTTFSRVGSIVLNSGEQFLQSAVIDTKNRFAYFGTNDNALSFDEIIKIDLSTFTRVDTIVLNSGERNLQTADIDTIHEFAYFGEGTTPGKVIKIDLSTFTRVGIPATLNESFLASSVIDPINGFIYFGTGTNIIESVVKFAIDFDSLSIPAVTISGNIVRVVGNTLNAGYTRIAGTATAIGSGFIIQAIVKNISGNASMWIGPSTVTSGMGYILLANETTPEIKTDNLANIFGVAQTSGQFVSYIATNQ